MARRLVKVRRIGAAAGGSISSVARRHVAVAGGHVAVAGGRFY